MAGGTLTLYNGVSEYLGDGTLDMDNDTFNITLHSSAFTADATDDAYADLNAELATANGYTNGGEALANVTWARSGAVTTFDSDDEVWTASGGDIAARYCVVRSVTADKLIGYAILDDTPADLTATDGNTLTVSPNAAGGWFQITANG